MAKKALIAKEAHKQKMVALFLQQRLKLRALLKDQQVTASDKLKAQFKMQQLPKRSIPCRLVNRCVITGRGRSVVRRFMLSRMQLREYITQGYIPGLKKASW